MAVIEIAKIVVRRGQEATTGMPQLDSGEFGWAEDTEHLYIGKRIVDGAINDENSRILTSGDLDNVFSLLANTTTNVTYYKYRNQASWIHSVGTTVQTKLDTLVSLVDYGVIPLIDTHQVLDVSTASDSGATVLYFASTNGLVPHLGYTVSGTNIVNETTIVEVDRDYSITLSTPTTGAISTGSAITFNPPSADTVIDITSQFQTAVANIFNNDTAVTDSRRELLIPAGRYAISDTIELPPYSVLKGAGAGLTQLILTATDRNMFKTVGIDQYGTTYTYEGNSGDLSAAYRPRNIRIEGMTLSYDNTLTQHALVSLDNVYNSTIKDVDFMSSSTTYSAGVGVDIRSDGGSYSLARVNDGHSQNIEIIDCEFNGMNIGIRATGTVVRPIIDRNIFTNLAQGISFATEDTFPGPSDGLITKNRFHNILKEGLFVGPNPGNFRSNHLSQNNSYSYVGNGRWTGDFVTSSTTFYTTQPDFITTSGSGINVFVINTLTYANFVPVNPTEAFWYVTTSTVNGIYSQITGTVTVTPTTIQFATTGTDSVNFDGTAITIGYQEKITSAINFESTGNRTENDIFSRKVIADQGPPGGLVESINVLNVETMGQYLSNAQITIDPPDLLTGVPATARPVVDPGTGAIIRVDVINHGYGYLTTPGYSISGLNSGDPAELRINLVNRFWYTPYVSGNTTINDTANYSTIMGTGMTADMAKWPLTGTDQQINIQYQLSSKSLSRKGTILVNMAADGYVSLSENYNYLTDVVRFNNKSIVPAFGSGADYLVASLSNSAIGQIPVPPTNFFITGGGIYTDLAAQIVSTGTVFNSKGAGLTINSANSNGDITLASNLIVALAQGDSVIVPVASGGMTAGTYWVTQPVSIGANLISVSTTYEDAIAGVPTTFAGGAVIGAVANVDVGTTYYTISTTSADPQFDYSTPDSAFDIGATEDVQPSFSWSKSELNNYVKISCLNPSVVTTATLEYQVNIQQL
jgi:hypothetical protein